MSATTKFSTERKLELAGLAVGVLTAVFFLALVTDGYHVRDQATRPIDEQMFQIPNRLGAPGSILATAFAVLVGDAGHVIYALTFIWALMLLSHRPFGRLLPRLLGAGLVLSAIAGFLQLNVPLGNSNADAGGAIGSFVVQLLSANHFGIIGANIVVLGLAVAGLLLASEHLFFYLFILTRHAGAYLFGGAMSLRAARARGSAGEQRDTRARAPKRTASAPLQEALPLDLPEPDLPPEPVPDRFARIKVRGASVDESPSPFGEVPDAGSVEVDEDIVPFYAVPSLDQVVDTMPDAGTTLSLDPESAEDAPPWDAPEVDDAQAPAAVESDYGDGFDAVEEDQDELEAATDDAPEYVVSIDDDRYDDADMSETEAPQVAVTVPVEVEPKPKVRRPRRKIIEHEELPPGYVYPRHYTRPPLDILDEPEERVVTNLAEQLRATSILLEDTLQTFGIEARVTDVTRGPTITRYELEPAPGIKVARFLALADDIALALKAHRIRVEAPIPGKGRVGIEAPNVERDQVLVRELLESNQFKKGKGKLNLVLGKDITGDVKIADLATMPHLLVAGATGAGKTVCVKALLASLLFKHTPDDLQLILIDPKMVELSIFNDIPHLITPVVIEPKKASIALTWLINEMEDRYRLFADLRVRNIEVYNQSVENGEIELEGEDEDSDTHSVHVIRRLPYIVCVIDELADLMMLARSEVEDSIGRLAQLARAVGIHLIIATQRPSVDVLTGVIKANFPSRISFQVSSRVDSRCILDEIGAERLIGMGDMLYLPAGQSKPTRIQGAFVSDEEMNALIIHLKRQAPPQYKDEIENFGKSKDKLEEIADEADDLFEEAVQVVMETGQASISMVQRRLRVGYTRAARLIDMMERKGIVGPHTGSKAREILVDTVQVEES